MVYNINVELQISQSNKRTKWSRQEIRTNKART